MRTRLRRPARGEGALIGLALAAGVTFAVGVVGAADAASRSADCAPLPADSFGAAERMAAGWRGDPSDGVEAIYPPECLTLP